MTQSPNRPRWFRSLSAGTAFLGAALVAARLSSSWIGVTFPDRPLPRDLLFEVLPYVPKLGYVADLAVMGAIALLLVHTFRNDRRELPKAMALFGVMQISRAFINLLTPLASPLNHGTYYGISTELEHLAANVFRPLVEPVRAGVAGAIGTSPGIMHVAQNGEFPSGHMASVLLCMLLVDRARSPRLKAALGILVVIEALTLIMSHQHYSIDVVGGLLLSSFLVHEYAHGKGFDWLKPLVKV